MKSSSPHVTLCTGFMQELGKPNGLTKLAGRLWGIKGVVVDTPMDWDANPKKRAKWLMGACDDSALIIVVGYSYGANTALEICREFEKAGRKVDALFLIDGVKRMRLAKWFWSARSVSIWWPWHKLIVPKNVKRCKVWRQRVGAPKGHPVFRENLWGGESVPAITDFLEIPHVDMDDADEIHDVIESVIRGCVNKKHKQESE